MIIFKRHLKNQLIKSHTLLVFGMFISAFVGLMPWIDILEKNPSDTTDEYLTMQRIRENHAIYAYHLNQHEYTLEYSNMPAGSKPIQSLTISTFPHFVFNKLLGLNGIILFHGIVNILIFIIIYSIWRSLNVQKPHAILFALAFTSQFIFYLLSSLRHASVKIIELYPFYYKLAVFCVIIISIYSLIKAFFKQKQSLIIYSLLAILCCIIAIHFQYYWNYFRDPRPYSTQIYNYTWLLGLILIFKKHPFGLLLCAFSAAILAQSDPFTFVPLCLISVITIIIARFWSFCSVKYIFAATALFMAMFLPMVINQIHISQSNFSGTFPLMNITSETAFQYLDKKHYYSLIFTFISFTLLVIAYRPFKYLLPLLLNIVATFFTLPLLYFTIGKFVQAWHYWLINPASVTLYASFAIPAALLILHKSIHELIQRKRDINTNDVYLIQSNKYHTPCSSSPLPIAFAIYLLGITTVVSSINHLPEEKSLDKKTIALIELTAELKKPEYSGKVLGTSDHQIMWYWSVLGNPSLNPSPISGIPISELNDRFAYFSSLFTRDIEALKQWLLNHGERESRLLSLYSKGQNKARLSESERRKLMSKIKENNYSTYRCDYILLDDTMNEIASDELLESYRIAFRNDVYTLYNIKK